jgi:hypothetical protein
LREHLSAFLTAVEASSIALERPVCRGWIGDYQITGKHGHVLADHPGYLLYVTGTCENARKNNERATSLTSCAALEEGQGLITGDSDAGR